MSNVSYPIDQIKAERAAYITKVYGWMAFALAVTALVSMYVASSEALLNIIFGNRIVFYALLFGEFALVGYLSTAINKITASRATAFFVAFAALNGLTLAAIFVIYTSESLASTFFITGGTFGIMSLYGYFTKKDLTSIGNMLFMALVGLIIASLVNLFFQNQMIYWITTYAGILIFVGLVAYDTQKIKNMYNPEGEVEEMAKKKAIMGALALYLDFINLFLLLLRLFGRKK